CMHLLFITYLFVCLLSIFFFFQAEDGIRDFHVTGVQTCALPISAAATLSRRWRAGRRRARHLPAAPPSRRSLAAAAGVARAPDEIGRASGRERGEDAVVGVAMNGQKVSGVRYTGEGGKTVSARCD